MIIQIAAKAVIFYNELVLLLVRNEEARRFDLPGGGVLPFENPEDGIRREIFEETKLKDIENIKPVHVWDKTNDVRHIVGITFVATSPNEEIVLSKEHIDYKWCTIEEFNSLGVNQRILQEINNARELAKLFDENGKI